MSTRPFPLCTRRNALQLLGTAGTALALPTWAQQPASAPQAWAAVERAARGQTVYFNAWAGSERINAYLQWATAQLAATHGVKLEHVKITDTADVVKRVRAEKAAGRGWRGCLRRARETASAPASPTRPRAA